jgi:cell surface protein SprA
MDTVRSQMSTFGKTMDYSHNYSVNFNLPLDKLPITDWMTANVKYGGTYNWMRAPLGQSEFGNTIQNNRTVNMTAQMNFTNLYNKVPFFKKVNLDGKAARGAVGSKDVGGRVTGQQQTPKKEEIKPPKPESEMTEKEKKKWEKEKKRLERKAENEKKRGGKVHPVAGFIARAIMTVRNVSGTYSLTDGTMLPGYNQESSVLGFNNNFSAPLSGFVFGQQRYDFWGRETGYNIATTSANNGWLVQNQDLNKQYTITHSQNLNLRASLEPMKDVTIELTANRTFGNNSNEFFRWNESTQQYESQSKVETGTLTYTNITFGSAFALISKDFSSATFDRVRTGREEVSALLGQSNTNSNPLTSGYYSGYGGTQQEVVVGAFLTAYSNRPVSASNINPVKNMPLPNWAINYNGLTKFEFAKKYVKNFVIRHAYSSTVSVTGLQTNLNAAFDNNGNATTLDINNNFIASRQIQNVTLTERFSPLLGFDATWNIKGQGLITKFEYKKDRSATLSLNNNQITEVLGSEWVIGSGYKFEKVKLPIEKIPASALNLRFDLSFRDNLTVVRKIVENTNQATAGQRVVSIKSSADYNVTQNLTVQVYYDQVINTPKIATSFPTGNMSTGIRLRFNLAGVQ